MAASPGDPAAPDVSPSPSPRRRRQWAWALVAVPALFVFACWWLTEPLTDRPSAVPPPSASRPVVPLTPDLVAAGAEAPAVWPEGTVEGDAAKALLLRVLVQAAERLDAIDAYTATFRKQERIKGTLGPVQTLRMKVRHRPFAVYLKFLNPAEGKEVVYAEGHHDNKVIAHSGGFARLLVPRLAVAPDHPLALADSRHPVTEAGLANLTAKLIRFRKMDLTDAEATTVLDRVTDGAGRTRLRSVHTHPHHQKDRPFARVEVLYDPDSFLPIEIRSFDWPKDGQNGPLELAEHYAYEDLNLEAPLTALDFDPANPDYAFHR